MSNHLLILILAFLSLRPALEREVWIVEEQSVLTIHGETNVNSFTCELPGKSENDTLIVDAPNPDYFKFEKGSVKINPQVFNCGNRLIKKDFLETLKADKYPYIYITFIDLKLDHNSSRKLVAAKGNIDIYICGVTRRYFINFGVEELEKGKMILEGEKGLNLKEFNIETKSRFMGLIEVKDEIDIQFKLLMSKKG